MPFASPNEACGAISSFSSPSDGVPLTLGLPDQCPTLPPLNVLPSELGAHRHSRAVGIPSKGRGHARQDLVPATRMPSSAWSDAVAWNTVMKCLELPLVYRSDEDIALSIKLLRRVPFFVDLNADELLSIAEGMTMKFIKGYDIVLMEKEVQTEVDVLQTSVEAAMEECPSTRYNGVSMRSRTFKEASHGSEVGADESNGRLCTSVGSLNTGNEFMTDFPNNASERRFCFRDNDAEGIPSISKCSFGDSGVRKLHAPFSRRVHLLDGHTQNIPTYILLSGKALLELPTACGVEHYPVLPYDVIGHSLTYDILPDGACYVSTEPCLLLVLSPSLGSRLERALRHAGECLKDARKSFLRSRLTVNIFENATEEECEECARHLLPIRLSPNQLLIEEGSASDTMYFLVEGSLAVTRMANPDLLRGQSGLPMSDYSTRRRKTGRGSIGRTTHPGVMQVAILHEGEFVGELGLIGHNPDVRPGEGVAWTHEYWEDALLNRVCRKTVDIAMETADTRCDAGLPTKKALMTASCISTDRASGYSSDPRYPVESLPYRATVYAVKPSLVYALPYEVCRRCIRGATLTRLIEYAKGYPSHDDLYEQYERQIQWSNYREAIVQEAVRSNPHKRVSTKFSPMRF